MGLSTNFILCVAIISNVNPNLIDSYVKHLCGGENTCYGGSNSSIPSDSCCRQCECDDICLEKGTCCHDKTFDKIDNVTMQTCLSSVKLAKSFRDQRRFNKYFVRAKCPERYENERIRHKCETGEPESLQDIPFVSSKDGKIVYKNRHCAACYDEEDVIPWKVVVDHYCIKEAFLGSDGKNLTTEASHIGKKLMTACSLSFVRPAVTEMRFTLCHPEEYLISSCDENQPQDNISEDLKKMCLNDRSALTFFHGGLPGKAYANVYCYLCNARWLVTCDLKNNERVAEGLLFLLNPTPLNEAVKTVERPHSCGHDDMYDSFFGMCRPMVCPMFEVPVEGKCTSLVASSKLNYGFNFQIVTTSQKIWQQTELLDLSRTLYHSLPSLIGVGDCSFCGGEIHYDPLIETSNSSESSFLYFQFVLTTSPHCERDHVLSLAAKLEEGKEMSVTYVIRNVSLIINYIPSGEEYKQLRKTSKQIFGVNTISCRYLTPSKFENCPKVILRLEEYDLLANMSNNANLQFTQNQKDNIEICMDDYERLVDTVTSAGREWTAIYNSFIPSVVFLLQAARWQNCL